MRVILLILLTALSAAAEFRRIEITFEPTGCVSCTESLQGRLERVRGVQKVVIDLDKNIITLDLEEANKVRPASVQSRITQDGTRIVSTRVSGVGTIEGQGAAALFKPAGLELSYQLKLAGDAAKVTPQPGTTYQLDGVIEPGADTVLKAESLKASQ